MRGFASIRGRMMVWVLAVAGLMFTAVILWSYFTERRQVLADSERRAVFLADSAARRIDAQLGVLQGVVHGMAFVLEAADLQTPFAQVRAIQDECLRANPGIFGVCVALDLSIPVPADWEDLAPWGYRANGQLAYEGLAGANAAHTWDDWFALPKYLERPVWSEPYSWNGVVMVTYSVPMYVGTGEARQFGGVVTCDLTLDWLDEMIASLPLGKRGYALLISQNATYVVHPMRDIVLNESVFSLAEERNDPALRATGLRMISGKPGIEPFYSFITRELSWLAYTPLRSGDWIMAALISHEEMNAALVKLSRQQLLIGVAGMLFLGLAIAQIARRITRPIVELSGAAGSLAQGHLDAPLPAPRGHDEVARLASAFSGMRDNLLKYIADLRDTTTAREKMHSELRIAHDIQMGLVPKTFPPFPARQDLDLYGILEPAREVGGDFYDFFMIDEDHMVLAIGDVSGKGVPAALFMAVTRSFLRSTFRSDSDPASVLNHVNRELVDGNDSCMFVTLFCAVLNLGTGQLQYANAGHNPPAVRYPDGRIEWIESPSGSVAGVMADAAFENGSLMLPAGATLVLYTDGVNEAMNPQEQLFGTERMRAALADPACAESCRALIDWLIKDLRAFTSGAEQSDDITMLVIKRRTMEKHMKPADAVLDLSVANNLADMERAMDEADAFLQQREASPRMEYAVRLAMEELISNVIKYAFEDDGFHSIAVRLRLGAPAMLTIEDEGRPFNPIEEAPAPVLDGAVEDRPVGGLGLFMLKEMGMKLDYRRENNRNVLTVVFPEK